MVIYSIQQFYEIANAQKALEHNRMWKFNITINRRNPYFPIVGSHM